MNESTKDAREAAKVTKPSDREVRSERVFDAPRERVWAAYTDPELIPQWWGRANATTTVDKMDLRPGGEWRIVDGDLDSDGKAFKGTYREVTPPERIVQTFCWETMPDHVLVETVTFEDLDGDRTKVTSTSLFDTSQERDGMLQSGMETPQTDSTDRLAELLARAG